MQLYGSTSSPFVRRLRLLLAEHPHEFISLNIFESADRERLIALNPTRKVPMLADGEQVVFDSGVIYRYLTQKFALSPLSWPQENLLTIINAANDSLVELLLCKRSGFDVRDNKLFFNLQHERVQATLKILNSKVSAGEFQQWDYLAMSLYCLVDWICFRELVDMQPFGALLQFKIAHQDEVGVAETDPRLG
ncbi:glutathione S-transferase family protein [Rheinheimera texasensis]|uniref:glutathione S-transferase family protein n=1 Tax=Rheinheimera texasensis TaxID=306205 RepID=UPI0032B2D843